MRVNRLLAFLLLAVVLIADSDAADEKPLLAFNGLGPVVIGMSVAEMEALGFYPTEDLAFYDYPETCHYRSNETAYPGIAVMMYEESAARIDVFDGVWESASGAKIGMTETEVAQLYASRFKLEYHFYLGKYGSYLIIDSPDQKYRMLFETSIEEKGSASRPEDGPNSSKRVTMFRSGIPDAVDRVEGCL